MIARREAWLATVLTAALVVSWVAYSPYYTLHRLQDSDAIDLPNYVDFPALRESIKGELATVMSRGIASNDMKDNPFAAIGTAIAASMTSVLVDSLVTPQAIANMARGQSPRGTSDIASTSLPSEPSSAPLVRVSARYTRWDRFEVVASSTEDPRRERALVLTRSGIGWKVVGVRFSTTDQ